MTNTDTAAPLTAEQIAWLTDQLPTIRAAQERAYETGLIAQPGSIDVSVLDALLSDRAALRDRLARAEARCVALESALDRAGRDLMGEAADFTMIGDAAQATWHRERAERLWKLATPTDGAARWHGLTGAEIEGRATEGAVRHRVRELMATKTHRRFVVMREELRWVPAGNSYYPTEYETEDAALADAAGRGADGEAGE